MDFEGRTFRTAQFSDHYWNGPPRINEPRVPLAEANVVCSDVQGEGHSCPAPNCDHQSHIEHKPVIDIDVPISVIPSSTPGHSHLYINHFVSWDEYCNLLDALVECGIVEEGYARSSKARGYTAVRLPWVRKQPGEKEAV